jgi:hypothetical protein
MSDFTIGEAVGTGFRVVRRKPLTLLAWFAFQFVTSILLIVLMLAAFGTSLAEMQNMPTGPNADPTAALSMLGKMMGLFVLLIPYSLLVSAVITTAANRAVLEPENSAFGYLRLGASELRVLVVNLVIGIIIICAYIASAIVGALIMGGFAIAARNNPALAVVGVLIMALLVLSTIIFLATRFALAPAQTLDTRSIQIFGSWSLTKGKFWKIFCVYLLCGLIVFGIYIVLALAVLAMMGVSVAGVAGLANVMPKATSIGAVFAPASLAYYFVTGLVGAFILAIILTPGAFMYQRLANRADEVF